jgi:chloride channel protein, CIC family
VEFLFMPTVPDQTKKPLPNEPIVVSGIAVEEDRLPAHPVEWLGLMIVAATVGAATGVVGAGFRICLIFATKLRGHIESFSHSYLPAWLGCLTVSCSCALAAGVACWLTRHLAPQTAGSGIPRVEAVLRNHLRPAGMAILPVKFIGGVLSIGSGLALGREGPTVQMGGTVGRLISDALRRVMPEPWTLIAAGAGAGLAVAFNAPLAAALFVMEELLRRFSARTFSATLVACITGTVVLRAILGNTFDFGTPRMVQLPSEVLPEYLVLGVLAGGIGVLFNGTLLLALRLFDRISYWPHGARGAIVGGLVGSLAWFTPTVVGGGEELAQRAIAESIGLRMIVWLLLIRFLLTMISYGSGAPGGIFAPLLALGAILGNAFATIWTSAGHASSQSAAFVVVSMAACFTAIVRSPLTGVVLLLEMTGCWSLILPMLAASVTAYAVPELLRCPPIYDSLRDRDEMLERKKQKPLVAREQTDDAA